MKFKLIDFFLHESVGTRKKTKKTGKKATFACRVIILFVEFSLNIIKTLLYIVSFGIKE